MLKVVVAVVKSAASKNSSTVVTGDRISAPLIYSIDSNSCSKKGHVRAENMKHIILTVLLIHDVWGVEEDREIVRKLVNLFEL